MLKLTSFSRKGVSFEVLLILIFTLGLNACSSIASFKDYVQKLISPSEDSHVLSVKPLDLTLFNVRSKPISQAIHSTLLAFAPAEEKGLFFTVHPDGQILGWDDGKAHLWQILPGRIDIAAFNLKKSLLALAIGETVSIVDLKTAKTRATLARLRVRPTTLAIQEDGKAIIIGGADGRVYRWKYIEEEEKATISERERSLERYVGHSSVISALATHPYDRVFFSGDWRGYFTAWLPLDSDAYSGEFDKSIFAGRAYTDTATSLRGTTKDNKGISSLVLSQDGKYLLITGEAGMLEVWSIRGFERLAHIQAHSGRIWSGAFSPDAEEVASIARDGMLYLFDIVDNPKYSAGSTQEKKRFSLKSQIELREGRYVWFKDPLHLSVFTDSGELIEPVLVEADEAKITNVAPKDTPVPTAGGDDY